ncbi:hypothetical protein [uncultured Roseibium sp.]|uniref:hypothetical protein n=1 Tax=uncultured Roseibium sp. TaxID=1936171 RepID=UPI003216EF7B
MSFLKSLIFRIRIRFLHHEAWALRTAKRYPVLAIYAFMTLWIWFIAAGLPFGLSALVLMEFGGRLGAAMSIFPAAAGLILILPWLFRWYLICAGLMFGKGTLAKRKEIELSQRLERLNQTRGELCPEDPV